MPIHLPAFGRRAFLIGAGAGAGLVLARGLGVHRLFGADARPTSYEDTLRALAASFTPRQRELIVFPIDHPSRQITNTSSVLERPHLGTLLSPSQQDLAHRLYESMLSPRGRDALAGTVAVEGRLDGCILALYGEPETGRAQTVIMGGHLMVRGGAAGTPDGAAFGGGVAYGHQIGNGRWRVEGNSFAYHGDAANSVYAKLSADERRQAILPEPPNELVLQTQAAGASFPGVRVGTLSEPAQEAFAALLETVFSCYPDAERSRAMSCIDGNGGPAALHVAYYASRGFYEDMQVWGALDEAERARRGDPYWQVWRIEGPGTIVHFKGSPHVHAYIQVVRDPSRANVGEALGVVTANVEGESMRRLYEAAMRRSTGEALAFHGEEVPGRFCPGEVTTGLAYALDPYRNHVEVATIEGRNMAAPLRDRLSAGGFTIEDTKRYRVASTDYVISRKDWFGAPESFERGDVLLRDALVEHLRKGGLDATA